MDASATRRFFLRITILLTTVLFMAGEALAQGRIQPDPSKPKIRAITAFINLDRREYQQQVADALKMLRRAQTTFESRGDSPIA